MPSSKKYKANRKSHYKHEEARRKKLHATKADPKASRVKVERQRLRDKLKLKPGSKLTAGHTGKGKLANKKLGKKPLAGKKEKGPGKGGNYAKGGASVKGKVKAVAKKGGYGGRKKRA